MQSVRVNTLTRKKVTLYSEKYIDLIGLKEFALI